MNSLSDPPRRRARRAEPEPTSGALHGTKLWVAPPSPTRDGGADFEHVRELPRATLETATVTVLMGSFGDVASSARHDNDLVDVEFDPHGNVSTIGLNPTFEYALNVASGVAAVDGTTARRCSVGGGGPIHHWDELERQRDVEGGPRTH